MVDYSVGVEDERAKVEAAARWRLGQKIGFGIGATIATAIVTLLIIGIARPDQRFTIDRNIAENKAPFAPSITLPVLAAADGVGPDGATVSLASLRGKPVVLNLWASWCPPCRDEAAILERLASKYVPRGAMVVGVNVRDVPDYALSFIREFHLTFPSLRDGSDKTEQKLQTTGLPETFIIDADGKMRMLPIRGQLTSFLEGEIAAHLDKVLPR